MDLTLIDFHVGNGLPFIHCYKPFVVLASAAQIDDQLVLVIPQFCQDILQSFKRKSTIRKEERRDYNLPCKPGISQIFNDVGIGQYGVKRSLLVTPTFSAPASIHD